MLDTFKQTVEAVATVVRGTRGGVQRLERDHRLHQEHRHPPDGAFVAFKALKLVAYIGQMTKAMRGFAAATAAANRPASAAASVEAQARGKAGKAGKLGRLAGKASTVFAGSLLVSEGIRSIPGWDKTMKGLGAKIADATVARGGPMPAMAGAGRAQVNVNGGIHLHGVQNVTSSSTSSPSGTWAGRTAVVAPAGPGRVGVLKSGPCRFCSRSVSQSP